MHALFKGRGSFWLKESFRGILTADDIGKKVHRSAVDHVQPFADSYLLDTQCCGALHRGTDFAAMAGGAFLAFAKARSMAAAIIFSDVVAAFYSAVRELVVRCDLTDEGIATVLQRAGIAPEAMQRLADLLALPPSMAQAGVQPFLQAWVTELHSDTWFSSEGVPTIAATHRGSRPGIPSPTCFSTSSCGRCWRRSTRG